MEYKDNLNNMFCLDIYLSLVNKEDVEKIRQKIQPKRHLYPLMSWGIIAKRPKELLYNVSDNLGILQKYGKKYNWSVPLEEILGKPYQAIVLTDTRFIIQWVSTGFKDMTGYSPIEAIGNSPRMLQGKNTSKETKNLIRNQLQLKKPCDAIITNYRQNQEEYECKLTIFPIMNREQIVTHFLALESEMK